jgi:protein-S-isoprenylcysteine O-methyltransferase Ste14
VDPLAVHDAAAHDLWVALAVGWGGSELIWRLIRREPRQGFDWSYLAVVIAIAAAFNVGYRLAHDDDGVLGGGWGVVAAGAALVLLGVAFRFWAIATLGRFFTVHVTILEGHHVVRSGPYRLLRHPSYTGILVALLGLGVALDSWPAIAAMVALPLAGLLVRIRVEEQALERALGDEYRRYAAETSRLVPGIW